MSEKPWLTNSIITSVKVGMSGDGTLTQYNGNMIEYPRELLGIIREKKKEENFLTYMYIA